MKQFLDKLAVQATSILLTAITAAAIAFLQTLIQHLGGADTSQINPEEVGLLGGGLKILHSAVILSLNKNTLC